MRIAFQISGELRNWKTAYSLYSVIKSYLEEDTDIEVDFFLHCWVNDYSLSIEKEGLLDIFNSYSMSVIPEEGVVNYKPKKEFHPATVAYVHALTLYPWSFSMFKASKVRREYQIKNNIKYDYIVTTRPDSYFVFSTIMRFKLFLAAPDKKIVNRDQPENTDFYSLYRRNIKKNHTNNFTWIGYKGNDTTMIGTEEAINLFSTNFHLIYLNLNHSTLPMSHNIPGLTAMKYNMDIISNNDALNLKATILRQDDGKLVSKSNEGDLFIEQPYLNSGKKEII